MFSIINTMKDYRVKKGYLARSIEIMNNVIIDQNCIIGNYTYIGQNSSITKAEIGRYCSIGSEVNIGPGEHPYDNISTSAHFIEDGVYDTFTKKGLKIGNDVWIGTGAIILRGTNIGNGAIIGAGAVITKDVPAYAIVVGVPAKVLKYRFSNELIDRIEKSQWWEYNLAESKSILSKIR